MCPPSLHGISRERRCCGLLRSFGVVFIGHAPHEALRLCIFLTSIQLKPITFMQGSSSQGACRAPELSSASFSFVHRSRECHRAKVLFSVTAYEKMPLRYETRFVSTVTPNATRMFIASKRHHSSSGLSLCRANSPPANSTTCTCCLAMLPASTTFVEYCQAIPQALYFDVSQACRNRFYFF